MVVVAFPHEVGCVFTSAISNATHRPHGWLLIAMTIEFLPFTLDGQPYFSQHNVVTPKPDQSEELLENGIPVGIKSLAFNLPDIGAPAVFKTDFDYFNHVTSRTIQKTCDG